MRQKILIVDDSEMERKLLSSVLEEDYSITEAENGYDALKMLLYGFETFDLVILDVMMPVIDGIEVLKRLRENGKTLSLAVIICTSESNGDIVVQGFNLGMSDFIVKPFDLAEIKNRVNKVLSSAQDEVVSRVIQNIDERTTFGEIEVDNFLRNQLNQIKGIQDEPFKQYEKQLLSTLHLLSEERLAGFAPRCERIGKYTKKMLEAISEKYPHLVPADSINSMASAAQFYDIGVLCLSDSVIEAKEEGKYERHVTKGLKLVNDILKNIDDTYSLYLNDVVGKHHIMADHSGYPDNLKDNPVPVWVNCVSFLSGLDKYMQAQKHLEKDYVEYLENDIVKYYAPVIEAYHEVLNDLVWIGKE